MGPGFFQRPRDDRWRRAPKLCVWLTFLLAASPAGADDELDRLALDKDRGWLAGSIQAQLDRDATPIPFGKGAVFVPAMTNPGQEPPVLVRRGEETVARGLAGVRIIVSPGRYTVELGSGTVSQRFSYTTEVHELHTSVVRPQWAGLAVHVVDDRANSVRDAYEVIRVDSRASYGVGYGTDEQAGEHVSTWILSPGLYKLVKVGESYRARSNFTTVRITPGRLTHLQLVVDSESSDWKGGGEVPIEELFSLRSGLGTDLVVGGDLTFQSVRNSQGGVPDGETIAFRVFTDGKLSYNSGPHSLSTRLQLEEEGIFTFDNNVLEKTRDRASIDLLYVYNWLDWLGPYVRAGVETNLLPGIDHSDPDSEGTVYIVLNEDDMELNRIRGDDSFRFIEPAGVFRMKQGLGVNTRLFKLVQLEASARFGVGARQTLSRSDAQHVRLRAGVFQAQGQTDNGKDFVVFRRIGRSAQIGVEGTLLATARLTRFLLFNLELDTLVPFDIPQDTVLELEARLSAQLTRFASIDYTFRLARNLSINPDLALEHGLRIRFSLDIR